MLEHFLKIREIIEMIIALVIILIWSLHNVQIYQITITQIIKMYSYYVLIILHKLLNCDLKPDLPDAKPFFTENNSKTLIT